MHKPFEVTFEQAAESAPDVTIIHVRGYLDAHTAPDFEQALQKARDDGQLRIVIDCERLDYISSAGLGVIVDTYRDLSRKGGEIKVAGMSPSIADIFDILGFAKIIGAHVSLAEALESFAETAE
jgi:anti-sigma B factor antagonist